MTQPGATPTEPQTRSSAVDRLFDLLPGSLSEDRGIQEAVYDLIEEVESERDAALRKQIVERIRQALGEPDTASKKEGEWEAHFEEEYARLRPSDERVSG